MSLKVIITLRCLKAHLKTKPTIYTNSTNDKRKEKQMKPLIGVDYYPEHWDESLWEADAEMMKSIGVKVVRMAEFAWCKIQPYEQAFDLDWLDRAIEAFSKREIKIILCTPTNCPPLWVYEKYPETLQTQRDGQKIATGIRGHRCYSSKKYRELCTHVIRRMVERYKNNDTVIAWQIDNEIEANECCCEECTARFRAYLKRKYDTLDNINQAYGNIVWSGEYSSWNQIKPPLGDYNEGWYNPAYMLDWKRFCKQNAADFVRFQANLIKSIAPDTFVTTNTWFCGNAPDYYDMFSDLDFVSYDNYPVARIPKDENALYSHAFHLDLMRGMKNGKPFCIMEQLSGGSGCWSPMGRSPLTGMIQGYSMQAIAHGADMVLHFRWRSARKGAEMFWHGLLDHDGKPNSRLAEFKELCKEVSALSDDLEGTRIENQCAIVYSSDSLDALNLQPQSNGYHYFNQLKSFHDALTSLGVGCDFIDEKSDLSKYKLLIAPALFITNSDTAKRIHELAEKGGHVILTNRCGVKDEVNGCLDTPLPCDFADMTGCTVDEYDPLGYDIEKVAVPFCNGAFDANMWSEGLALNTASEIAHYEQGFLDKKAAATQNDFGKGKVYYIGFCSPQRAFYISLMRYVLTSAGISFVENLPRGVEITQRKKDGLKLTFVFNNSEQKAKVATDKIKCELEPFEMKILKQRI